MKKLIGIMLVICMLFTVAAAANTITQNGDPVLNDADRTVTVKFAGIPGTEQATLFAYEVTDAMITEATPIPAFVSNEATPIKGIDQATVSAITTTEGETSVTSFTFKVAADYVGKMVVKVGGTDATPISMLVEFEAAGSGEGEKPETTILIVGDVNMDGTLNATDSAYLALWTAINPRPNFDSKREELKAQLAALNYEIKAGEVYVLADNSGSVIIGDVNMDGTLNATDSAYLALWTAINPRPNFDNKREELKTQLAGLNYNIKAGESKTVNKK